MIGELAALGAAISWTISAILYRKALQKTKPISANIIRLSLTSAVLLLFLITIGKFNVLTSLPLEIIAVAGISGIVGLGLGDTLYMESLKLIGVARAVPLTCTYPLFSLVWVFFLEGEQVTSSVIVGAIVIVLGIWLVSHENRPQSEELPKKVLIKGLTAALATALLWSISITLMDVAVNTAPSLDHALVVNTVRTAAIALFLLLLSPILDRGMSFRKIDRKTAVTLLVGGIVALGFGWFLLAYSFVTTWESTAIPISSITPLFSTLAGVTLFKEKITARNTLGSIIIVAGVIAIFLFK